MNLEFKDVKKAYFIFQNWGAPNFGFSFLYKCSELRGVYTMAESRELSESKSQGLGRWLSTLIGNSADTVGAARLETLEIMTDIEQVSEIFASFEDIRQGRIVKMSDAFGDL